MQSLELKIPPLALVVLFAGLMWLLARLTPGFDYAVPLRQLLVAVVSALAVLIALAGVASFRQASTTVNPLNPENSSALVVSGIYRITRNPMYLGFLLLLAAWALMLANLAVLLLLPVFVWYMDRFQILPEERALAGLFGNDYTNYCARVRRWL
ncbi:MAG: protein-S-isoprenylcysteine methyltransferase [Gammaproteobacteria bacterium]|nr:protein-S-isoprenylcysteine methyltransferase [Gammaproteobacteria bacterium]MBJ54236.1 protein-S-isoprenylcysteine methyltransferase [Gammaproteobacteria bacterium]HBN13954.1 isoprenylcysteine carboxylmethyltransferase family protein [Pseudohongiella sp.]|tara:strand:+ start:261 stop:722 length:462 start_codon:yes stop_codon:yes gene_type:complete